jgi:MoaA/NifB/PqqE/SkfB family radical SAM enzyme
MREKENLMKAVYYHTSRVPCKIKISESNEQGFCKELGEEFMLSDGVVARFEPEGLALITPLCASQPIFVDSELGVRLSSGLISNASVPLDSLDLLKRSGVVTKGDRARPFQLVSKVNAPALPLWGAIEVTSKCNCNCQHCYYRCDLGGFSPLLSDVIARIDKMHALGIVFFEVTGGEALLRPDLHQIIGHLNDLRVHHVLISNGEYLKGISDELMDGLRRSQGVRVSIDGIGLRHNLIRRREGLYERIILGLDRLKDNGIKMSFNSTLSSDNRDEASKLADLAQKYETMIRLRPEIRTGAAQQSGRSAPIISPGLLTVLQSPHVVNAFAPAVVNMPPAHLYGCTTLQSITVDIYGQLMPCIMDRSRRLGDITNLSDDEYASIIVSERERFFGKNISCQSCEYKAKKVCGGFCRFSNTYQR